MISTGLSWKLKWYLSILWTCLCICKNLHEQSNAWKMICYDFLSHMPSLRWRMYAHGLRIWPLKNIGDLQGKKAEMFKWMGKKAHAWINDMFDHELKSSFMTVGICTGLKNLASKCRRSSRFKDQNVEMDGNWSSCMDNWCLTMHCKMTPLMIELQISANLHINVKL